ncbi:hypothetical protein E6C27_scaffold212G00280 [Cucumis melo var. makuwa]|uniref:Uncharacterized protein n=2 Tax=Cucumis melo TaxID=3656 RepID=A0A5A7V7L4_CUCMM|nr:hypothetical protein E6C27_scaffold212G00280 [Cucumis melo var. makuwa]
MGISKVLSFVCVIAILVSKVADADSDHFGIHAVGHAVEPFCPGGYSDRGDHCQHLGRISSVNYNENDDDDDDEFDDRYKVVGKLSVSVSPDAEDQADGLELGTISPDQQLSNNVIVLGH